MNINRISFAWAFRYFRDTAGRPTVPSELKPKVRSRSYRAANPRRGHKPQGGLGRRKMRMAAQARGL